MLCLDLPFVEIDAEEEDEDDVRMADDGGLEDCAELAVRSKATETGRLVCLPLRDSCFLNFLTPPTKVVSLPLTITFLPLRPPKHEKRRRQNHPPSRTSSSSSSLSSSWHRISAVFFVARSNSGDCGIGGSGLYGRALEDWKDLSVLVLLVLVSEGILRYCDTFVLSLFDCCGWAGTGAGIV